MTILHYIERRLKLFFLLSLFCFVAVEGKLLKAHKIILSICSPYFQEMFIKIPCQHPIIILKDMSAKLVCNLLEFMYKGSVNVKQVDLQAFMKIAEALQIKGLTNSSKKPKEVVVGEVENKNSENKGF
jgi:BTB/POZ domain